jgi:hypothetical protein
VGGYLGDGAARVFVVGGCGCVDAWVYWFRVDEWGVATVWLVGRWKIAQGKVSLAAKSPHFGQIHTLLMAQLGQQRHSNDIAAHRLKPVVFALHQSTFGHPVLPAQLMSRIGRNSSKTPLMRALSSNVGGVHDLALSFEQAFEVGADRSSLRYW